MLDCFCNGYAIHHLRFLRFEIHLLKDPAFGKFAGDELDFAITSTPTQIINVDKKTAFRYPVVNRCCLIAASIIPQVKKGEACRD